jgi:hypothetical protein
VSAREGIERLYCWLLESRGMAAPQELACKEGLNAVFAH